MNIKQVATHLERLNQPYDIIISKNGNEQTLYANLEPNNVRNLLQEVVETHEPDKLIIQERKRNGSVNKKTQNYPVSIESNSVLPMVTNNGLAGLPQQNFSVPSDYKDYLIKDLERKVDKYESKIDKLENDNDRLKKENFELEKEAKFKDKEFEIATRSKELEQSNGLSGILETVSNNPALANITTMAIGRLMNVDMSVPQAETTTEEEEPNNTAEHTGVQAQVAKHLTNWLIKQKPEVAEQFYKLANKLANDVTKINYLLKQLTDNQNGTV